MRETSSAQKVCSFYVSNMHFATMILPFVNKQMEEKTKIVTFFLHKFSFQRETSQPFRTIIINGTKKRPPGGHNDESGKENQIWQSRSASTASAGSDVLSCALCAKIRRPSTSAASTSARRISTIWCIC